MLSARETRAIGSRVGRARQAAHLSQAELAQRLQVLGFSHDETDLRRLERGSTGTSIRRDDGLLIAIAAITGVHPTWLAYGVTSEDASPRPR